MTQFNPFIDLVFSIKDKALLRDFMIGVTTEKERQELLRRVEIVKQLIAGKPQLKIARDLGVGVATVTRGSKELARGRFKALKNIDQEQRKIAPRSRYE